MADEYLSLDQAAALAGVGRAVAYARVLDGRWPSDRGPRRVYRIPRAELVLILAREPAFVPATMEGVIRELGEVVGLIEQIPVHDDEAWLAAQKRLRNIRARAVQLAEYAQLMTIRRALKERQHEADPADDRAA